MTNDGKTMIDGDFMNVCVELSLMITAIRKTFAHRFGDEFADYIITKIGELAYAEGDDIESIVDEIRDRSVEQFGEGKT